MDEEPEDPPAPALDTPDALATPPQMVTKKKLPSQVTFFDTDELDPEDPDVLQIRTAKSDEKFVLGGAKYVLANATLTSSPAEAIPVAQLMLSDVAKAEAVALTTIVSESDPHGDPLVQTFTIHTLDVLKGKVDATWTLDFPAERQSCGCRRPIVGTEVLFVLQKIQSDLVPMNDNAIHALTDGVIGGYPGVLATVPVLKAAIEQGKKVGP